MTNELRRQEVQTWKKVIRVISHELNNSLAPVASLAHSGAELVRRGRIERLEEIFGTIEERARHLEGFIRGYARFAKLPQPLLNTVDWTNFLASLQRQIGFELESSTEGMSSRIDQAQMEQALLNLLKNAHEAGGEGSSVSVKLTRLPEWLRIEVLDRGAGMNESVLQNALVPFYSTKRNGTGLGLALTREIVEAHGGRLSMHNREGGGLCVAIQLPDNAGKFFRVPSPSGGEIVRCPGNSGSGWGRGPSQEMWPEPRRSSTGASDAGKSTQRYARAPLSCPSGILSHKGRGEDKASANDPDRQAPRSASPHATASESRASARGRRSRPAARPILSPAIRRIRAPHRKAHSKARRAA